MDAYVTNVGCEQRALDAQRVMNYLSHNNVSLVNDPKLADYVFVITCGVDSYNEEQSIIEIKQVTDSMDSSAKLFVGGCLPSISPKALDQFDIFHSFSPRSMESLDGVLGVEETMESIPCPNTYIFDSASQNVTSPRGKFEQAKNGYKVRIAQGCLGACSYCVIKDATGKLQSEPSDSILSQITAGQEERTIMLMAGDTGAYGLDIGTNFATLLGNVVDTPGEFKLYIHDFGVNWLIRRLPEYVEVFDEAEKTMKMGGMTLPIQSGSSDILRVMRRNHTGEDAISALCAIQNYPFDIGTHIMVGFPGEHDKDFEETLRLLRDVSFDFVTCFPYSERPGASSALLQEKIPEDVVAARLEKIVDLLGETVKVVQ